MKAILAAALLLAGCFGASAFSMPPKRFDHHYHGKLRIYHIDSLQIRKICGNIAAAACSFRTKGGCVIFQGDRDHHNWLTEMILRHEVAHCNGWPSNHSR